MQICATGARETGTKLPKPSDNPVARCVRYGCRRPQKQDSNSCERQAKCTRATAARRIDTVPENRGLRLSARVFVANGCKVRNWNASENELELERGKSFHVTSWERNVSFAVVHTFFCFCVRKLCPA